MGRKMIDLTGQRFGKLVVAENAGKSPSGGTLWKCVCDCGNTIVALSGNLRNGHRRSCGCIRELDLSGEKFGMLTAVKKVGKINGVGVIWECVCECGNMTTAKASVLIRGKKRSCGCLSKITNMHRHNAGIGKHPLGTVYDSIKARCYNKACKSYKYYGARGIRMADEWLNDFWTFAGYMTGLPHYGERGYSIDRIDVNGNYAPGNVRWATAKEQANNRKNNKFLAAFGETKTIAEWASETGINYYTLWSRIREKNWDVEKALTTPTKTDVLSIDNSQAQGEKTCRNTET